MNKKKFIKIITPIVILFCIFVIIIYINFQKSKFKIEENFSLKKVIIEEQNSGLFYIMDKQDIIKQFYYSVQELKESKITIKALKEKPYTPLRLSSDNKEMCLMIYDENVVYKNKVYEGKAVSQLNKLIANQIATEQFINMLLGYSGNIIFRLNEVNQEFNYNISDSRGARGNRDELVRFIKDSEFHILGEEEIKNLNKNYPSYDIVLKWNAYMKNIELFDKNIISLKVNEKIYYIGMNKNLKEFVQLRLPEYTQNDLMDLYKAKSVKDKDTEVNLTSSLNKLNENITKNDASYFNEKPSRESYTLIYNINGKDEEVKILRHKIIFRDKEYVVNNVGITYENNYLPTKNEKIDNSFSQLKKEIQLKDGEYGFSANNLLFSYVKDKEDKEIIDKVFELYGGEKEYNNETPYGLYRNKNGKYEKLSFGKDILNEDDRIKSAFGDKSGNFIERYMNKNDVFNNMNKLVTEVIAFNDLNRITSRLTDANIEELTEILNKSKFKVDKEEIYFNIIDNTQFRLFINNGENSIIILIADKKAYIKSNFTEDKKGLYVMDSNDFSKLISNLGVNNNLIKQTIPINEGNEIKIKYKDKTIDATNKGGTLNKLVWGNKNLFTEDSKSIMDIGEDEIKIIFDHNGKQNEVKINKDSVYENGSLMYKGRYYISLVYNQIIKEFGL